MVFGNSGYDSVRLCLRRNVAYPWPVLLRLACVQSSIRRNLVDRALTILKTTRRHGGLEMGRRPICPARPAYSRSTASRTSVPVEHALQALIAPASTTNGLGTGLLGKEYLRSSDIGRALDSRAHCKRPDYGLRRAWSVRTPAAGQKRVSTTRIGVRSARGARYRCDVV